jgi:hypothetical protein
MTAAAIVAIVSATIALVSLGLSLYNFFNQRTISDAQRSQKLMDRLYEFDRMLIQNPELQVKLESLRNATAGYFFGPGPKDADYIRLKTFVYWHINFFDEIMLVVHGRRRIETVSEFDDWKTFIIEKMRHPLFREIYTHEQEIFGAKLRTFISENWAEISKPGGGKVF